MKFVIKINDISVEATEEHGTQNSFDNDWFKKVKETAEALHEKYCQSKPSMKYLEDFNYLIEKSKQLEQKVSILNEAAMKMENTIGDFVEKLYKVKDCLKKYEDKDILLSSDEFENNDRFFNNGLAKKCLEEVEK